MSLAVQRIHLLQRGEGRLRSEGEGRTAIRCFFLMNVGTLTMDVNKEEGNFLTNFKQWVF